MGKKKFMIPKRETTQTKIDLARDAIFEKTGWKPHAPIYRKIAQNLGPIKGMHTIPISNKRLCGMLSLLCDIMREEGIAYPWREAE